MAIGIGWIVLGSGKPARPGDMAVNPIQPDGAFAEFVTPQGRTPLALGKPVKTDDVLREILLGGMHRVVMNRHTEATFSAGPRRTAGRLAGKVPYEIQLARGELYVEVVPGNPFTVLTANARLDITGTKFDVLAEGEKTKLALLKGSVRFSTLDRPQEPVSVTAGHASRIVGQHLPAPPAPADALATTAWARDTAFSNAVALADRQANADLSSLSKISEYSWPQGEPPDVDTLDYQTWLDAHRQAGFAMALPAVGRMTRAIGADWIELLMISGDIWQFHYEPKLPPSRQFIKLSPADIARLARHYGLDEAKLRQTLGLPDSTAATPPDQAAAPGPQYAGALRCWHDAVMTAAPDKPKANDDLKLFSLYAGQYLAETRTAAYLWAKAHPDQACQLLADSEYRAMLPTATATGAAGAADVNAWLKLLRDEANAARHCVPAAMEWLLVPPGTGCAYQATERQRRLAALAAELTPPDQQGGERQ